MRKSYTECSLGCSYPNYKEGWSLGWSFAQPQEKGSQSVIGPSKFFGVSKNVQDKKEELSDSENNNILQNIQRKRDTDMSYVLTVALKDEIYIATDSRSTVNHPDGNQTYSDNYQKIVIIPDTNIVVASTGLNSFGEQNFRDIVYTLQNVTQQNDIFENLFLQFKKYEDNAPYLPVYLFCATINKNYRPVVYYTVPDLYGKSAYQASSGLCECYSSGTGYANAVTNCINISEIQKNPVETISSIMRNIISISALCDNTIGGPIQMVRITPEKAEWVDGFKPDFIK